MSISFSCFFRGIRVPFIVLSVTSVSTRNAEEPRDCGSGVFKAEQDNGAGGKGSGDAITIDVKTCLEVFMEVIDVKRPSK